MGYTMEIIKSLFEKDGYTVLSKKYLNTTKKLKYICPNNHTHWISLKKWLIGQRCPYCKGVVSKTLEQVKVLFENEGYELLNNIYHNTNTSLDFICPNGHKHTTTLRNWNKGSRCPYCSGKVKKDIKEISELFRKEGYTLLSEKYINCESKLKYLCPNGHTRFTTWSIWNKGYRCPECSCVAKLSLPYIKERVNSEGYILVDKEYINNHNKLTLICPNDHTYKVSYANWSSKGYRCPKCSEWGVSKAEKDIISFIASIYKGKIITNDRSILKPKEIDIVIPELKLAIEYCGLYWHSELLGKSRKYHLDKLNKCKSKGYRLITIFEDEWVLKNKLTKSRLASYINSSTMTKIFARKCIIKDITPQQARSFCEDNHLQGYGAGAKIKLGAFYKGGLVSIMTFSKPSLAKGVKNSTKDTYELHRFCSKVNTSVVGIASKLLKYFERNYIWSEIFSFADRRWSTGNLYEKLGFTFDYNTAPNYWYFKGSNLKRIHRFKLRKNKLDNTTLSEWQNRKAQGYNKIWDCGNIRLSKMNN